MSDDIAIGSGIVIPDGELSWRFGPSGGPGGQHANRSSTRAELSFDLLRSPSVPDEHRRHMIDRLGGRARGGVVTVAVDESRSQWRNRVLARRRLAVLLTDALRREQPRKATRPSYAARRNRLEEKRRRSETKRRRRRPSDFD